MEPPASTVLKVLDNYIVDQSGMRRERRLRLALMFAASLILHAAFYALVLKLDRWSFERMLSRTREAGGEIELIKLADVAPPPDRLQLVRRRPEPVERIDLSRLKLDLDEPDDSRLIARSPNPSRLKGEERSSSADPATKLPGHPQPPVVSTVEIDRRPESDGTEPPRAAIPQPAAAQPPPIQQRAASGRNNDEAAADHANGRGGGASELGLAVIEGQYIALVRAKIWKENERSMPRDWIEAMLTKKVSADFELRLNWPGRVASLRLVRSSGYSTLDNMARQAITTASPFEGFPQEAGDTLTFRVTVYYTPNR